MTQQADAPAPSRFARLAGWLEQDVGNVRLLLDAAEAGLAEEKFAETEQLLLRHEQRGPLPPEAVHLAGLAAMRIEAWDRAAARFSALLASGADAPGIRFNLAWSLAMDKRFAEALPLLDADTSDALGQAAQLEIELLHQLGDYDRAGARARLLIERHPGHRGLNAAVSTLAIDIEDNALALASAQAAGDHPDALVTLGTLALGEDDPQAARALFDAALARNPNAPRGWVGLGLTDLLAGDQAGAARALDRGAEMFASHLGSWIAAGWAHLLAGDRGSARARFERALALDDSFGEAQGSLAVLDIFEGRLEEAKRRTQVARRLDAEAFSTAFASMLLVAGAGDPAKAQRIFETALNTPVDATGRTLAQSIARLGAR